MSESGINKDLAPWIQTQVSALLGQRGHAWLLQGPSGLGQYPLALELARAWLCEHPSSQGACGACASCHAVGVRTHADLCALMPETTMIELGWPLSERAQSEIDDKKRKASKEIRVDAMRDAVEFAQRTSARGRGKVVLVFPAENMNDIAANTLLKTLEEPAGDVQFVLASESAHQLLPTIRSRCIGHTMSWPSTEEGGQWLQTQGMDAGLAQPLLRAAGGRPADAIVFAESGLDPLVWAAFPRAMAHGNVSAVKDWTVAQIIDAQHKLCHDLITTLYGAAPRFFEFKDLSGLQTTISALGRWGKVLSITMKTMNHPFNVGLMTEALVGQAQSALNSSY